MSRDTEYWKGALKEAREQHQALCVRRDTLDIERDDVNRRIIQLEHVIASLQPVTSESPLKKIDAFLIENATEIGLADAVREVLKNSNKFMAPVYIRDVLVESGYDLSQYSNALASIHGVLKRMVESGEVEMLTGARGTMYRWKNVGLGSLRQASELTRPVRRGLGSADGGAGLTGSVPPTPPTRLTRLTAPKQEAEKGKIEAPIIRPRRIVSGGLLDKFFEEDKKK